MEGMKAESSGIEQERCPNCGKFCGVVYRGPTDSKASSCLSCGLNPPKCSHEDGTVTGCGNKSTHEGSEEPHLREKYWCEEHAPDGAEILPYAKNREMEV